jgi:outer membrane protein TolC
MVRFWALVVAVLSTLGVAGRLTAQGIEQDAEPADTGEPSQAQPATVRVYHVDEFTQSAILRYPGLKAAEADIEAAQARLDEARLSPFFQFEGTARFFVAPGARGTAVFSPDPQIPWSNRWGPGGELGVQGGIPLYTFGKIRSGKKAARAGIKASESAKDLTLNRVVFDVRRAYYGVQLALDLQALISEGKDQLRNTVDKLRERLEADDPAVQQKDYFRLATALAEVESRESEALRLEASARAALELLTGIKPAVVPECPLEVVESEVIELGDHVERALVNRPEVFQLDAAREARDANLVIKRAGYLPDIILALSATFARTPGITDIQNPYVIDRGNFAGAFFGLVAKWKLDFAGTNARVKTAKSEIASLKAKTTEAKLGIELEVNDLYERLQDAKRRVGSWSRSEKEARKWFITSAQGYEVGTMDSREYVDSLTAYFSARSNRLMAMAEYNLAIAALEKATNVPMVSEKGWRPADCEE